MRISELFESEIERDPDIENSIMYGDIERIFPEHGYKKIGGGKYSQIWKKRNGVVAKAYEIRDTCYTDYLEICWEMQGNPWVPRVSDEKIMIGDYFVIWMEELSHVSNNLPNHPARSIYIKGQTALIDGGRTRGTPSNQIRASLSLEDFLHHVIAARNYYHFSEYSNVLTEDEIKWYLELDATIKEKDPALWEIADVIGKIHPGRCWLDIDNTPGRARNIMKRRDGQVVIVDPLGKHPDADGRW